MRLPLWLTFALLAPLTMSAQEANSGRWSTKFGLGGQGSRNIHLLDHIPLCGRLTVGDIEAELLDVSRERSRRSERSGE